MRSRSQPSPWGPPGPLASGQRVSWGPRDRLRAVSCRAPEPSPGPPTGWAQALKQPRTSPPSPPPGPNGSSSLQGSQSVEASATGLHGHCYQGNSFNQLQSLHSSFKNWSSLDQLSIPRRWPEVRVKLQRHCTSLLQIHLCSWAIVLKKGQLL